MNLDEADKLERWLKGRAVERRLGRLTLEQSESYYKIRTFYLALIAETDTQIDHFPPTNLQAILENKITHYKLDFLGMLPCKIKKEKKKVEIDKKKINYLKKCILEEEKQEEVLYGRRRSEADENLLHQ